jgi:hypothetical protein
VGVVSHGLSLSLALPPALGRGRWSPTITARYEAQLRDWCAAVKDKHSRLDFTPGTRGWCYLLEEHGLLKGDFGRAEDLLAACRIRGWLDLDICREDDARTWQNLHEAVHDTTAEQHAAAILDSVRHQHRFWTPFGFWDDQPVYLMLLVEKIDLVSLWSGTCDAWHLPYANMKGWWSINQRATMLRRFKAMEAAGKQCVLLVATDFDPPGQRIAISLRENIVELAAHPDIRWDPSRLLIDHFALTRDFIEAHSLPWIDGLITGSGKDLSQSKDRDVQAYIAEHGKRKVEANALVVRPEAGRQLLTDAITKYLPASALDDYALRLQAAREELRQAVAARIPTWTHDSMSADDGDEEP